MQTTPGGGTGSDASGIQPASRPVLSSVNATRPRTDFFYACCVCGFLVLVIGIIYGQTLGHHFVNYDDSGFVYANPQVRAGLTLHGIKWAFTEGPYGEWYPLAPLSHMLDCQIFGLNPWGHHLTSVLLHAATSIALFLVWWRMTGELWPSSFVATVFAVHAQHVESVAWVAERRDVLSGLFFVLTLAAYLGYVRHGRSLGRYCLVAAMLALGLMAKPMLVTVPPLLLLLDFWPLARMGRPSDAPEWTQSNERPGILRLILEKLPLWAFVVGDCLMTLRTHLLPGVPMAWPARIGNAAVSCVTYIIQFFYPANLAVFYPYPETGLPTWKVFGSLALLAVISAAAVIWRRRCPYLFVGWFWWLGMLFPVLGLVQVSDHAMADRYMYLPGIGLYIVLAWGATRFCADSLIRRQVLAAAAALAIVALTVGAVWQTADWYDDESLWRHALASIPGNSQGEALLANALAQKGNRDEAIVYFQRAQQHPLDAAPFNDLGVMLAGEGKSDEAIVQFRRALAKDPKCVLAHVNLTAALVRRGELEEGMKHFHRAIEINPRDASPYIFLANVFQAQGKTAEARAELERAIAVDPNSATAENDLGSILVNQGKADEAIPCFAAAVAIDPYFVLAQTNLASTLAASGRTSEAIIQYRRALQLDPRNWDARAALDELLRKGPGQPHR